MSGLLNPSVSDIVGYVKLGLLVLEYGFKLVKWFRERYDHVEEEHARNAASA